MGIVYDDIDNTVKFNEVIYEDEIGTLRDYLQEKAGEEVVFDFKDCNDIHLAVLQLVLAYKKSYTASYEFGDSKYIYESVLKGFVVSENNCS